jgi:energy-coupling factor transport system permease protein
VIRFRYRDKGSAVHRVNPLSKLAWGGSILVLALLFDNPLYISLLLLSTLPLVAAGRVWKEWASLMKLSLYLCVLIVVINAMVSYEGSHVLYQFPFKLPLMGTPRITFEAIIFGIGNALRLLAIMSAFAVLTLTIHPDDLMLAMIKLKLPYKSVLVTSLATRFVPTLVDDVERITDVQRSRGLELNKGGLRRKVKGAMSIMIPLLSNSLERTVQVAEAMESRAFGSRRKRTSYRRTGLSALDIVLLAMCLFSLAIGISMSLAGQGAYDYYPTLQGLGMPAFEVTMLFVLVILLLTFSPLAYLRRRVHLDQG